MDTCRQHTNKYDYTKGDLTFSPLVWYSIFMATMVKEFNTPTCDVGMRRCESDWSPYDYADVVELADTLGLGPSVARREGSSPFVRICASAQ